MANKYYYFCVSHTNGCTWSNDIDSKVKSKVLKAARKQAGNTSKKNIDEVFVFQNGKNGNGPNIVKHWKLGEDY